jgi:hypothetical protein
MKQSVATVALGLTLLLPMTARAEPVLQFNDPIARGGTIVYDGAGGPATGTDILLQNIVGVDTPKNNGAALACLGCTLSFTTGANISEGPDIWGFAQGGSFQLTGSVPGAGIIAPALLIDGTFTVVPLPGLPPFAAIEGSGTPGFGLFFGSGPDVKSPLLAAFYGLGPAGSAGFTILQAGTFSFDPATGAFSGTNNGANINNFATVPNPAALLLLGAGLAAAALGALAGRLMIYPARHGPLCHRLIPGKHPADGAHDP